MKFVALLLMLLLLSCSSNVADGPNVSETTNGYMAISVNGVDNSPLDDGVVTLLPVSFSPIKDSDTLMYTRSIKNGVCTLKVAANRSYNLFICNNDSNEQLFIDSITVDENEYISITDILTRPGELLILPDSAKLGAWVELPGSPFKIEVTKADSISFISLPPGTYQGIHYYVDSNADAVLIGTDIDIFTQSKTIVDGDIVQSAFVSVLSDTKFNFQSSGSRFFENTLWTGSTNGGIYRYKESQWTQFPIGSTNPSVTVIYGFNNELLTATEQGIYKFIENRFENVPLDGNPSNQKSLSFFEMKNSLFVLLESSIALYNVVSLQSIPMPFSDAITGTVTEDSILWVGTSASGIYRCTPSDTTQILSEKTALISNAITFIENDHSGGIWIGTDCGLNHMDATGNWSSYTNGSISQIQYRDVSAGHFSDGIIWFVNGSQLLVGFDGTFWRSYSAYSLFNQAVNIESITSDTDGNLWIGSNGAGQIRFTFE